MKKIGNRLQILIDKRLSMVYNKEQETKREKATLLRALLFFQLISENVYNFKADAKHGRVRMRRKHPWNRQSKSISQR